MKGRPIDWQPEELAWIEARKEWPRAEAHALFCARFMRSDVSIRAYNSLCKRKGWLTGRTGCFEKGHATHNKGQPMPEHVRAKLKATMFKPGGMTGRARQLHKPIGFERLTKEGYLERKVHDGLPLRSRWRAVNLIRWEEANGPLPAGHALKCLDGDRLNTDPRNWAAIPRALLPRLNGGRHRKFPIFDAAPAEVKPAILAVAKLDHAARRARDGQP